MHIIIFLLSFCLFNTLLATSFESPREESASFSRCVKANYPLAHPGAFIDGSAHQNLEQAKQHSQAALTSILFPKNEITKEFWETLLKSQIDYCNNPTTVGALWSLAYAWIQINNFYPNIENDWLSQQANCTQNLLEALRKAGETLTHNSSMREQAQNRTPTSPPKMLATHNPYAPNNPVADLCEALF